MDTRRDVLSVRESIALHRGGSRDDVAWALGIDPGWAVDDVERWVTLGRAVEGLVIGDD